MAKEKSYRTRLIGMIHMQKSAAHITDDGYRLILMGATGKLTCSECSLKELFAVHKDLNTLLVKQGQKAFIFHRGPNHSNKPTIQNAVETRARKVLGENWKERLDGFLHKLNRTSVKDCTENEIRRIMGWISTTERRQKNAR